MCRTVLCTGVFGCCPDLYSSDVPEVPYSLVTTNMPPHIVKHSLMGEETKSSKSRAIGLPEASSFLIS